MSRKGIKKVLAQATKPDTSESEKLKAELDMAVSIIISQKMTIADLKRRLRKKGLEEYTDY
jgi:SOS response regulatory protein OraA/RecX